MSSHRGGSRRCLVHRLHSALYWAVITATTLVGTPLAEFFDRSLGIGYAGGSIILFFSVVLTLLLWKRTLGIVGVEMVRTPQAEGYYWATILFSQTLGTALGDWMADTGGLGHEGGALIFVAALAVVVLLYARTQIFLIGLFWAAFILTRPLGATVGDFVDKPVAEAGLNLCRPIASAFIAVLIVLLPQRSGQHADAQPANP